MRVYKSLTCLLVSVALHFIPLCAADTLTFHELFTCTYSQFTERHSVWVTQFIRGSNPDSVLAKKGRVTMDSAHFLNGDVVATGLTLYYKNDTLGRLTFFLDAQADIYFMCALKKGVWARETRPEKFRKFRLNGEVYFYKRSLIPSKNQEPCSFAYCIYDRRSFSKRAR